VCAYPRDFEVFRIYLSAYHRVTSDWLSLAAERIVETNDIYFILDFNSNIYCRDVLSRQEISPLINPSELGPLLSREMRTALEQQYTNLLQSRVSQRLEAELREEAERWNHDFHNDEFVSNFSSRIIQIMRSPVDRSVLINEGFGMMVSHVCLSCFLEFLHSFHKMVERVYCERDGGTETPDGFICRITNILNCCPPFRDFASRMANQDKTQGAELLCQAEGTLERIIGLGTRGICDLVLHDLK
ncbi:exocyst complex component 3-like protein 2, partial [Mantella aurantiaca]